MTLAIGSKFGSKTFAGSAIYRHIVKGRDSALGENFPGLGDGITDNHTVSKGIWHKHGIATCGRLLCKLGEASKAQEAISIESAYGPTTRPVMSEAL